MPSLYEGKRATLIIHNYNIAYGANVPYLTPQEDPEWQQVFAKESVDACPDGHALAIPVERKILNVRQGFALFTQVQFRVKIFCTQDGKRPTSKQA